MLTFSEIFECSRENSYFERIRMVRMVRMVRSLADRTFQLCSAPRRAPRGPRGPHRCAGRRALRRSSARRREGEPPTLQMDSG